MLQFHGTWPERHSRNLMDYSDCLLSYCDSNDSIRPMKALVFLEYSSCAALYIFWLQLCLLIWRKSELLFRGASPISTLELINTNTIIQNSSFRSFCPSKRGFGAGPCFFRCRTQKAQIICFRIWKQAKAHQWSAWYSTWRRISTFTPTVHGWTRYKDNKALKKTCYSYRRT